MAGIERIKITDKIQGRGARRFQEAKAKWPNAHRYYQFIFNILLKCPLEDDSIKLTECGMNDIEAAYDRLLGVDVIFNFANGQRATCQEKLCKGPWNTVTVELYNDPVTKVEGDWFDCKANYYFMAWSAYENPRGFNDWMFLDWAAVQRASSQERIEWKIQYNRREGAKASFKYVEFDKIPNDCIIARGSGQDHYINEHFLGY